jgi:nucleotide-binding universal stress UspA family protein
VFDTILILDGGEPAGVDALRLARYLASDETSFVLAGADSPRLLRDAARQEQADLVVIPSGKAAKRLLHGLEVPVAVSRPEFVRGQDDRLRVIGVGFDAGDESRAALHLAEQLALEHGATMRVYAVVPPHQYATSRIEPTRDEYRALLQESLGAQLHEEVQTLDSGVRAAASVVQGDPVEQLADASRQGLDLLVVGARRQGPLGRLMLGSVSSELVDRSGCPLLVLPRPVEAATYRAAVDSPAVMAESDTSP